MYAVMAKGDRKCPSKNLFSGTSYTSHCILSAGKLNTMGFNSILQIQEKLTFAKKGIF